MKGKKRLFVSLRWIEKNKKLSWVLENTKNKINEHTKWLQYREFIVATVVFWEVLFRFIRRLHRAEKKICKLSVRSIWKKFCYTVSRRYHLVSNRIFFVVVFERTATVTSPFNFNLFTSNFQSIFYISFVSMKTDDIKCFTTATKIIIFVSVYVSVDDGAHSPWLKSVS